MQDPVQTDAGISPPWAGLRPPAEVVGPRAQRLAAAFTTGTDTAMLPLRALSARSRVTPELWRDVGVVTRDGRKYHGSSFWGNRLSYSCLSVL